MMALKTLRETFVVRSYQTDPTDHLAPTALLQMMQEMAGAHAELLNVGNQLLTEHHLAWVLTRVEVRMQRYPKAHERLHITTFPMPNRRWLFPRYFLFHDDAGNEIGCAGTLWALLDVKERKIAPASPARERIPDNSDMAAPFGLPCTVSLPDAEALTGVHRPAYTDLDVNGHVNNTKYLDWCCNALGMEVLGTHAIRDFALNFHLEVLPGHTVQTELRRTEDRFSYSGFVDGQRHFDVGGTLVPREALPN